MLVHDREVPKGYSGICADGPYKGQQFASTEPTLIIYTPIMPVLKIAPLVDDVVHKPILVQRNVYHFYFGVWRYAGYTLPKDGYHA